MEKRKKIELIKKRNRETYELRGPCLCVHDVQVNDVREKRRLYRCFTPKIKKETNEPEYYLVETNIRYRKVFGITEIDDAINFLFSEQSSIPKD